MGMGFPGSEWGAAWGGPRTRFSRSTVGIPPVCRWSALAPSDDLSGFHFVQVSPGRRDLWGLEPHRTIKWGFFPRAPAEPQWTPP